jgi:hypothetical protein
MNNPITDHFDSRDLIEYRESLQNGILEAYVKWAESHNQWVEKGVTELEIPDSFDEIEFIDEEAFTIGNQELIDELAVIEDFCNELDGYGDFEHGESIVAESYFTNYAEDLTTELGYIPDNLPSFIADNIDWKGVAEDLKVDYMEADYKGTTYYMRA